MHRVRLVTVLEKVERPRMWQRAEKVSTDKPIATKASVATVAAKAKLVKFVPSVELKNLTASLKKARS